MNHFCDTMAIFKTFFVGKVPLSIYPSNFCIFSCIILAYAPTFFSFISISFILTFFLIISIIELMIHLCVNSSADGTVKVAKSACEP